ncbi:hypothetical protein B0H14DRAFT_2650448 [Mycena olivaceomarginata]|nr:hypothetical protein B0H14DRAFT_2650448 [Mycena olivaceomarginata]
MQTKFVSLRIFLSALAVSQFVGAAPGPTVDCSGVRCASVQCAPHQIAEVPAGACCPAYEMILINPQSSTARVSSKARRSLDVRETTLETNFRNDVCGDEWHCSAPDSNNVLLPAPPMRTPASVAHIGQKSQLPIWDPQELAWYLFAGFVSSWEGDD